MNRRFFGRKLTLGAIAAGIAGAADANPVYTVDRYRAWIRISKDLARPNTKLHYGENAIICGMAFFDSDGMLDDGITSVMHRDPIRPSNGVHLDFHEVHGNPHGRPGIIITDVDPLDFDGRFAFAYLVTHDGMPPAARLGTTNSDGVIELDLSM